MNPATLKERLLSLVEEDQGPGDLSARIVPEKKVTAEIIAKECCRVSGVHELKILFGLFGIDILDSAKDKEQVTSGQRIFILSGRAEDILLVERTALNILSRMSAITTLTWKHVLAARAKNPEVRVAATRKTTPGFTYFEKKAVRMGGGDSHRVGLYDMLMLKDNHLKLFPGIAAAVEAAKKDSSFAHKIEIEVGSKEDAAIAIEAGADIVMLDNMTPAEVKSALAYLEAAGLCEKSLIEVSGGVNLENIEEYAKAGPDVISVGALTHSAGSVDLSLKIL